MGSPAVRCGRHLVKFDLCFHLASHERPNWKVASQISRTRPIHVFPMKNLNLVHGSKDPKPLNRTIRNSRFDSSEVSKINAQFKSFEVSIQDSMQIFLRSPYETRWVNIRVDNGTFSCLGSISSRLFAVAPRAFQRLKECFVIPRDPCCGEQVRADP